jgi:leader peptidase (prepilin peptidase)/N-methyltransferase
MNGTFATAWAVLGLAAGAAFAPAAYWLAGSNRQRHSRVVMGATTATTFLLTAARSSTWYEVLAHSVFVAIAVQLAAVDLLARRLPRVLIWPTCVAETGILAAATIGNNDASGLLRAGAGAIALAGGYIAIAFASRGGLGAGDVRLAVLVGGLLGWHGWPALVTGAALGFIGTGLLAAAFAVRRIQGPTPHGPGMLTGTLVALLP